MEPVVCVERAQCRGKMRGVVMGEFGHGKKASPVGLLEVAVHAQVLFQHRIHPLRLAIRLGMEGRRAIGQNPQQLQQPPPKMRCENWIPITDDGFRHVVNPDHMLNEKGGHVRCGHGHCGRDEDCLLSQPVHDDQDSIMVVTRWQIRDPVEGHAAPGLGRDSEGI